MTLSANAAERISTLYEVAKRHGSLITLEEIAELLPEPTSKRELAEAISSSPLLRSRFTLKAGYVTERINPSLSESFLVTEKENRNSALRNLLDAKRFLPLLHSTPFKMVSVSGSTSYLSASRSRDLDLFCISASGKMWRSLTQALVLARVFELARRPSPQVCLSCVMDEEYAFSSFGRRQDPLFARDALATIVMKGNDEYEALLRRASWISTLYPAAYSARTRAVLEESPNTPNSTILDRVIDQFLFAIVGTCIRTKSWALNRKLGRLRGQDGIFTLRLGKDHLIYESRRYSDLRRAYSTVRTK